MLGNVTLCRHKFEHNTNIWEFEDNVGTIDNILEIIIGEIFQMVNWINLFNVRLWNKYAIHVLYICL